MKPKLLLIPLWFFLAPAVVWALVAFVGWNAGWVGGAGIDGRLAYLVGCIVGWFLTFPLVLFALEEI